MGSSNRVKIGLEPLSGYEHLDGTNMIAEGDLVMTEHTERWHFHTGEVIDHSFVSVTQLRDGKIFRWHDYSNIPNITDNAPAWWLEHIMKAAVGRRFRLARKLRVERGERVPVPLLCHGVVGRVVGDGEAMAGRIGLHRERHAGVGERLLQPRVLVVGE